MILHEIEPQRMPSTKGGPDLHVFTLKFVAADGSRPEAVLTGAELTSYGAVVAFVAQATGRIFLDPDSEGLPPEQADRFWRLRLSAILNGPGKQQQPAQATPTNPNVN